MVKPPRFLLVDPDAFARAKIADLLFETWPQCSVTEASDTTQATGILRERSFDAILADQDAKPTGGAGLLSLARQERPEALRILLARRPDFQQARDAINLAHVHAYLPAAASPADVKTSLTRLMTRTKASRGPPD